MYEQRVGQLRDAGIYASIDVDEQWTVSWVGRPDMRESGDDLEAAVERLVARPVSGGHDPLCPACPTGDYAHCQDVS